MIRQLHAVPLAGGGYAQHEGLVEGCPATECKWPRLRTLVTCAGPGVTGKLVSKDGDSAVIETSSGARRTVPVGSLREPDWGTYCVHGLKIVEAEPAEHTCGGKPQPLPRTGIFGEVPETGYCLGCYPTGRKVSPWPCKDPGCAEALFDEQQRRDERAYWDELNSMGWD